MIFFNLSETFCSVFELYQVRLLHIISYRCVTRVDLASNRHLLARLLKLHLTPLNVIVDGIAEDSDLGVELIVLLIVELRLEPVGFCCL